MPIIVFVLALAYAVLRYGLAQDVPVGHWPAYVGNKAVAFTALGYVGLGMLKRDDPDGRRRLFSLALVLGGAHAFASAAMMGGGYYEKLSGADGLFTWQGEMVLVTGVTALALMIAPRLEKLPSMKAIALCLMAAAAIHVSGLGGVEMAPALALALGPAPRSRCCRSWWRWQGSGWP